MDDDTESCIFDYEPPPAAHFLLVQNETNLFEFFPVQSSRT